MPSSDLVPCFYTGQNDLWEKPAKVLPRAEVRELKEMGLGRFENHGKTFRLAESVLDRVSSYFEGPMGIGNLLPFAKQNNYGDKLHYEMPHAGDRGIFARHYRKLIHVSGRIAPELAALSMSAY